MPLEKTDFRSHIGHMRTLATLCSIAGLLAAPALLVASEASKPTSNVEVTFVNSQDFTDFSQSHLQKDDGQEYLMASLREFVAEKAESRIAKGQRLQVTFTDIDLAGDFEPWRTGQLNDVRIVKEVYPPRAKIEFKLLNADGSIAAEGKRNLANLGFMYSVGLSQSDPLRYDKELLSDWIRTEFPAQKK